MLVGGLAQPARALDGEDTNSSANLWLPRAWQTDEGLPDNNVTGVAQTRDGHLWVATLGGLMRFDGERFEGFSTTHLPKVPNRVVLAMYLDRRGQLWLVMERGVVSRVGETDARVFDATDGQGQLWFACGLRVGIFQAGQWQTMFTVDSGPVHLAAARTGGMWICTGTRVMKYTVGDKLQEVV